SSSLSLLSLLSTALTHLHLHSFPTRRSSDLRALAKQTDMKEDRKSGVITITVTDHDPKRAQALAQAYVDALNRIVTVMVITPLLDRKSTRLNSSHRTISYAVFCLKKKNKKNN